MSSSISSLNILREITCSPTVLCVSKGCRKSLNTSHCTVGASFCSYNLTDLQVFILFSFRNRAFTLLVICQFVNQNWKPTSQKGLIQIKSLLCIEKINKKMRFTCLSCLPGSHLHLVVCSYSFCGFSLLSKYLFMLVRNSH